MTDLHTHCPINIWNPKVYSIHQDQQDDQAAKPELKKAPTDWLTNSLTH